MLAFMHDPLDGPPLRTRLFCRFESSGSDNHQELKAFPAQSNTVQRPRCTRHTPSSTTDTTATMTVASA
jgi:hypothetical protein